jgi:signal transduction histidine kinase/CheY-like chemotaxis protein
MSIHNTCLKSFIEIVPSCFQAGGLRAAVEIMRSGQHDRLVVVDAMQRPIGLLHSHRLLSHLLSNEFISHLNVNTIDRLGSLSALEASLLEPLVVQPAHLTLAKSWEVLQQLQSPLALVDAQEQFLGLLDPLKVVQFFAQPAIGISISAIANTRQIPPGTAPPQPYSAVLLPLIQLLEQMPLPFMLQTGTGQVITQNSAWVQQVGEILDPSWVGRDAAAQFSRTGRQVGETTSPQEQREVPGEAESTVLSLCQLGNEPNTCICICPMKNGQERALQFVKIPLGKTLPGAAVPMEWFHTDSRSDSRSGQSVTPTDYNHFQLAAFTLDDLERNRHYGASFTSTQTTTVVGSFGAAKKAGLPLFAPQAEETLWIVMAQDVTEQQQLARELTAKNADLIQLNRLKDEFLACISHELKTPLTAVLGLSNLLKDQMIGKLNDRQERYAQLIYQSGRHLMMVVNDILDLTRMETGQVELMLEPVTISSVCERAIEQAQQLKSIEEKPDQAVQPADSPSPPPFLVEIEPGLETLVADELRLRQMLVNLLSNALKFTEVSGQIGLKVNHWAGWIAFTVWDTGIGIPADKQHLIFQKFQQLENPLTRRFEGTGLGLVLTQRLARLHGGDVTFTSKEGQGSQFTLLLPPSPPKQELLAKAPQTTAADESYLVASKTVPASPPRSDGLVLVVEAVPRYVDELNELLMELGYLVIIARSGTEALEKARRLQPRVIFLNPLLPLLSGWDVLTLLKSDPQLRHIPIVVTATRAEKEQAYRNHADSFLNLPIRAKGLQQVLDRLMTDEPSHPEKSDNSTISLAVLRLRVSAQANDGELLPIAQPRSTTPTTESCDLNNLLHAQHYRVLEADDLDQAELLARVWQPKVILLDGALPNPQEYLKSLSQHHFLASLPIVTLDQAMTEAANQIPGLSVFPCLVELSSAVGAELPQASALLQAIQVATGYAWRPLILAVDTSLILDLADADELEESQQHVQQTEWLGALMQYVQTAGYRSVIGHSWTEVLRRLQHQNADLLLICWHGAVSNQAIVRAIVNLRRLARQIPIVILDYSPQPKTDSAAAQAAGLPDSVRKLAACVLPASAPIPEMLEQIQRLLQQPVRVLRKGFSLGKTFPQFK